MTVDRARLVASALVLTALLGGCQQASAAAPQATRADAPARVSASTAPDAPSDGPSTTTGPATAAPSTASGDGAGAAGASSGTGASPVAAAPVAGGAGTALAALALLPVKGRAPMTGYSRDQFGPAWKDVDRNGCDTRNDVLARDLVGALRSGACIVVSGTLPDPYSGTSIAFVRGAATSSAVQIDHVVALGDAWQTGAQQWDATRRTALANDPMNLLAVKGSLNEQKGDGDAATWLPPSTAYRCAYVARQVAVKYTYGLWVTSAERDAIARVLAACPAQPLPAGSAVPPVAAVAAGAASQPAAKPAKAPAAVAPAPAAAPAPARPAPAAPASAAPAPAPAAPAPAPAPATGPFANCTAAWNAGAAPLHRGDPGYAPKLDRDGDGVACEKRP